MNLIPLFVCFILGAWLLFEILLRLIVWCLCRMFEAGEPKPKSHENIPSNPERI